MECKRCGNNDPEYFYKGHKGYYCRRCVTFKRQLLLDDLKPNDYDTELKGDFSFDYELTPFQKEASRKTKEILNNKDVLLHCVCGAGKTEIVVESISHYIKQGLKVCYAISRREVVIELGKRFKEIFKDSLVTEVYGGNHNNLYGDLIVCTTHQLFRYQKTFDLLILDEVDAFPLSGNDTLMNICLNASKGRIIFSTATINPFLNKYLKKRDYEEVSLLIRPSLKPLIEPKVFKGPFIINLFYLARVIHSMTNQCIIFVSKKKEAYYLNLLFKYFYDTTYVYSDYEYRNRVIKDFKDKKFQFLFSTTVLERGITIKDVDVIIFKSNNSIFDKSSIIQMTGRVGRNIHNPSGNAYIITNTIDSEIKEAIKEIKEANNYYKMSILRQ